MQLLHVIAESRSETKLGRWNLLLRQPNFGNGSFGFVVGKVRKRWFCRLWLGGGGHGKPD